MCTSLASKWWSTLDHRPGDEGIEVYVTDTHVEELQINMAMIFKHGHCHKIHVHVHVIYARHVGPHTCVQCTCMSFLKFSEINQPKTE